MTKLIAAYRRLPTTTNRRRLQAYIAKHPASWALASKTERDFLTANQFEV
jgi:hypothetical protein